MSPRQRLLLAGPAAAGSRRCRDLQVLFSIPGRRPMAFNGGTSLSKVYGVIDRFSEDVDITLDYRAFAEGCDPFAPMTKAEDGRPAYDGYSPLSMEIRSGMERQVRRTPRFGDLGVGGGGLDPGWAAPALCRCGAD